MKALEIEELRFNGANSHQTRGWLCKPAAEKQNNKAVLVIHELLGLIDNLKPIMERFAEQGYTVFAPDLFDKPGPTVLCVARTLAAMQRGKGPAIDDLNASIELLRKQPGVDPEKIGVVGFCMGGGFAMLLGLDSRVRATAPYYGGIPLAYKSKIASTSPVVASYGARDLIIGPQGKRLQKALKKCGAVHDFKEYQDAGHSFMTVTPKGPFTQFGPVTPLRAEYHEEAAEDSWRRMLTFFEEHI